MEDICGIQNKHPFITQRGNGYPQPQSIKRISTEHWRRNKKKNKCQNCVGIHGAVRRFHTQYTDGSKHVTASRSSSLFEFASPYSTDLETQNCTLSCHWKPSTEDLHPTYIQTVLQSPQATHDNAVAVLTRQQYCACNLQRGR